jgi:hypothetical protein
MQGSGRSVVERPQERLHNHTGEQGACSQQDTDPFLWPPLVSLLRQVPEMRKYQGRRDSERLPRGPERPGKRKQGIHAAMHERITNGSQAWPQTAAPAARGKTEQSQTGEAGKMGRPWSRRQRRPRPGCACQAGAKKTGRPLWSARQSCRSGGLPETR